MISTYRSVRTDRAWTILGCGDDGEGVPVAMVTL